MLHINRQLQTVLLTIALLALWLLASGGVIWAFAHDVAKQPSQLAWLALACGAAIMLGLSAGFAHYFTCRVVAEAALGDDVQLATLLARRRYRWEELVRINIQERTTPVPTKFAVKLACHDGRRYVLWANAEQANAIEQLARSQPRPPADWPGLALDRLFLCAALLLGAVVLTGGIVFDGVLLFAAASGNLQREFGDATTTLLAILAAIVVPLLGLASCGFAAYHLLVRPIMVHPGIVRTSEAAPASLRDQISGWFGSPD
jgi:hypothetical protein